jgi:hypothetical protein
MDKTSKPLRAPVQRPSASVALIMSLLMSGPLAVSTTAYGGGAGSRDALESRWTKRLVTIGAGGARTISLHPFQGGAGRAYGLSLYGRGLRSLAAELRAAVQGELAPGLELRRVGGPSSSGLALSAGDDDARQDYALYAGGFPLCDHAIVAHSLKGRQPLILGTLPAITHASAPTVDDWAPLAQAESVAAAALHDETGARDVEVGPGRRCLLVSQGRYVPTWRLTAWAGPRQIALPYHVWTDGARAWRVEAAFFDATGKAKAYPENKLEGEIETFDLPGLDADGTLTSAYFTTVVPASEDPDRQRAQNDDHVFDYDQEAYQFDEVQAYVHAQVHYDFAVAHGWEWWGPKPLDLKLHFRPFNRPNNALYMPGDEDAGTRPSITIDDGDNEELRNLVSDGDVLSHEFGHHVLFATLKTTTGESLVLHEGLADLLAFSRTDDPNLGESICPEGSSACQIEGTALRTAVNDVTYGNQDWQDWIILNKGKLGHLHGQLVSGLLWDLHADDKISADDLATLVVKAATLFKRDSGLRDFIIAALAADRELFDGKHQQDIVDSAKNRKLDSFLEGITVGADETLPDIEGGAGGNTSNVTDPVAGEDDGDGDDKDRGNENPLKCGTIGGAAPSGTDWLVLLLLVTLPLAAALLAPVPARVKARAARSERKR